MRTPYSRLNDNIGRRIRHLEAKLSRENEQMMQWGYKEQIQHLKDLRTEVQKAHKEGKDTLDYLYEKELDMKKDGNLSTSDRDIRERMEKTYTDDQEIWTDWMDEDTEQMEELFDEYSKLTQKYVGISGTEADNALLLADKFTEYRNRFGKYFDDVQAARIDKAINNLLSATSQTRRPFREAATSRQKADFSKLGILQPLA